MGKDRAAGKVMCSRKCQGPCIPRVSTPEVYWKVNYRKQIHQNLWGWSGSGMGSVGVPRLMSGLYPDLPDVVH